MLKHKKSNIAGGFTRSQLDVKETKKERLARKEREEKERPKRSKGERFEDVIDVDAKRVKLKPSSKLKTKTVGTALVVSNKKTQQAIESNFGKHSQTIINMLEMNNNDGGITLLKKRLLQMTVNVLPAAEQQLVETGAQKGVYQFATLVSQIRELITDIKADEDRKYIAQSIAETILKPAFMGLAQDIINDHHDFRRATETYVKTEHVSKHSEELRNLAKDLANKMTVSYREVSQKIYDALKG